MVGFRFSSCFRQHFVKFLKVTLAYYRLFSFSINLGPAACLKQEYFVICSYCHKGVLISNAALKYRMKLYT